MQIVVVIMHALFLSTLSLRRATKNRTSPSTRIYNFYPRSPCGERRSRRRTYRQGEKNFYPRSPCGERHNINSSVNTADKISIHALLAESDPFLSPPFGAVWIISIHALLAESDIVTGGLLMYNLYFYPRSPCGERRRQQHVN